MDLLRNGVLQAPLVRVENLELEVRVKNMVHFWVGAAMLCSAWQSCDKSPCKHLQGQGWVWLA